MVKVAFEPHLKSINEAYEKYFSINYSNVNFSLLKKPGWNSKSNFKISYMVLFSIKSFFEFIFKYDLVHINGAAFGIVAYFASWFGAKYIYTIHGCPHLKLERKEGKKYLYAYISSLLMKITVRRAKAVYTISKFSQKELWNQYRIKSLVIYNGYTYVDSHYICDKEWIKMQEIKGRCIFISVGRMVSIKNPFRVIDIFHQAIKKKENAYLIFIGNGDLKKEVEKYSICKGVHQNINFVDSLNYKEMIQWYKKADYFISGCDLEGFGLAALEAVAYGCIPILPARGAFLEIFPWEKILYDPEKIEKISIPSFDENDKKFLKELIRPYEWSKIIKLYEDIYIKSVRSA